MRKLTIIVMAALMVAACKAPQPAQKDISIQLYSVRELLGNPDLYAANHESVLKTLADMGYTSVEAANYGNGKLYGVAPEQFKADVEAAGLKVLSSHTTLNLTPEQLAAKDFSAAMPWWEECIAAHKAAGMKYIVVPSMRLPETLEDLKVWCDYFNAVGKLCKENGLLFGYHSHSFEFVKIEDQMAYDFMVENTNPDYVFFEMDVYWAVYGRVSPVNYFKKYPGRFKVLHIKDYREVGQSGMVGFDAIFANAKLAGTKDIVVEMEGSTYGDILRTCQESVDYLKALLPNYEY